MLDLLLDENISPVVAEQVSIRRPDISIQSIFRWRGGTLTNESDRLVLQAAAEDGLTLVTYDQSTMLPLALRLAVMPCSGWSSRPRRSAAPHVIPSEARDLGRGFHMRDPSTPLASSLRSG